MAVKLIAQKSGKTVDVTQLTQEGGRFKLEAVAGEQYQLIDSETGKTPEDIKVTRQNDRLVIQSTDNKYQIILEEFWSNCTAGEQQCTAVFDVAATENTPAGQVIITQVGEDVSAFTAGTTGTLPPPVSSGGISSIWWYVAGGVAAAGGIAAAAGGGGGSDNGGGKSTIVDNSAVNTFPEYTDYIDNQAATFSLTSQNDMIVNATNPNSTILYDGKEITGSAAVTFNNEKAKTVTIKEADGSSSSMVINNPHLDWLMNSNDDSSGTDHTNGWTKTDNNHYQWLGDANAADVIVAEKYQTETNSDASAYQGMIGSVSNDTIFKLDTQTGGNDYIQSEGMVGNVSIKTNDGADIIQTNYINGRGDFDGSERIEMGDGDDVLKVVGKASFVELTRSENVASFYLTNAKVDMGNGNDTVLIANSIYAGNQRESGNYFNLGAGDDIMETKTITSQLADWEGSNIINLGTGNDKLTIKGDITSDPTSFGTYKDAARFLLISKDSSMVSVTGNVMGRTAMLMGDGTDNIHIDGNLNLANLKWDDASVGWLRNVLSPWTGKNSEFYKDFYEASLRTDINDQLKSSFAEAKGIKGVSSLDDSGYIAPRIDLGDGKNTLTVAGVTSGTDQDNTINIIGGTGVDTIQLGADSSGYFKSTSGVSNTKIWTGDNNDAVMLSNVNQGVKVYSGAGDDVIHLYGAVNGSSSNIFDGGAGYDTVIIGGNKDGVTDKVSNGFIVSGEQSDHSNLWSMEEIQFNSKEHGDWVKIAGNNLSDQNGGILKIRGSDELIKNYGEAGLSANTVDAKGWGHTGSKEIDGIQYNIYSYKSGGDDYLYVQQGIKMIL